MKMNGDDINKKKISWFSVVEERERGDVWDTAEEMKTLQVTDAKVPTFFQHTLTGQCDLFIREIGLST